MANSVTLINYSIFQSAMSLSIDQLLTYDYSQVQDNEELSSVLLQYQRAMGNISKEIKDQSYIKDRNEREHEEVVAKMQKMQEDNLEKTKSFRLQIEKSTNSYNKRMFEINEAHEKYTKQSENKHNSEMKSIEQAMGKLQEMEKRLQENERQEVNYLNEIRKKSADLIEMQYSHHDHMNREQRLEEEENKRLFMKNLDVIKELKKNVKAYATDVVYEEKELNEERNYELKVKLLELQDEISRLRNERNSILKTKKENKINISLNEEELEEYKVVGSIQKSKIKMYNDKIENVKKLITEEMKKLQARIDEKNKKWHGEIQGLNLKLVNLERDKEQMKINLEKYKMLGETILMQRQEVEEFFLMAIESCKRDMDEWKGMEDNGGKQYGERVDIEELQPKDRHRILTNLYTKLALASSK